jgi:uncharacterized protein (TIGR00725 family)
VPQLATTTIGVFGSGIEEHVELSEPVGRMIAEAGANLLTGGGGGVMTSVARAFVLTPGRAGLSIGIIPCAGEDDRAAPKFGYPNRYVELPIFTHLPYSGELGTHDLSRNHINVLSSRALIALPGGLGTASECDLAARYGRPLLIVSGAADLDRVAEFLEAHAAPP